MTEDPFYDDDDGYGRPLPPEDRIWRHPSEVGGIVHAARRRREVSNGRLIGFAAGASLLGSVLTVAALAAGGAFDRTVVEQSSYAVVTQATDVPAPGAASWPQVVAAFEPALVRVEASGGPKPGTGSAVVFRSDAGGSYVVTSRDLVLDTDRVTVVLGGERRKRADIVGTDQYTNLAVLRVPGERLEPPAFATGDPPAGSDALVVGAAPAGASSPAVAKALIGSVQNTQRSTRTGIEVQDLLRTDANISPDAKGGALVDHTGAFVGLIVIMAPDETGVERFGFALPAATVRATAESLIRTGFPTQVWLGIAGKDLPTSTAVELGVPGGAVLDNVAVDSPAAQCGLVVGDVVTKLNTTDVDSMTRLVMTLRGLRPADTVAIEFLRAGVTQRCFAGLDRPPGAQPAVPDGSLDTATPAATPAMTPGGSTVPPGGSTVPPGGSTVASSSPPTSTTTTS